MMGLIIKIILGIAILLIVGFVTLQFCSLKSWLLWAVANAEYALGSNTGELKLRLVYDETISKFGFIAKIIPFTIFKKLVDGALVKLEDMLRANETIKSKIKG